MKVTVYNTSAKKTGTLTLPKEIFAAKINSHLMAQAVRVFLNNQRQATRKTKTRGEVRGSGRKIWRQKGTGRARHGDRYAPIFVGGGIAHGPRGEKKAPLKLSKKMKKQALFSALSSKAKARQIKIITGLSHLEPKTKTMHRLLNQLFRSKTTPPKLTIILSQVQNNAIRAGRNLPQVSFSQAKQLNTYQILNSDQLLFTKKAIKTLKDTFLARPKSKKSQN